MEEEGRRTERDEKEGRCDGDEREKRRKRKV